MNVNPATEMAPLLGVVVVFACAEYPMVAGPVPLAAEVTCNQETLLDAVQVHPASPVSRRLPLCDCAEIFAEFGLIAKSHGGPACVIVMLCEPTVIVPVREGASLFRATVKLADPLPVPVCPKLIVIQLTFDVTGLAQLVALATMVMVPSPPAIGKDWGEAVTVNVQV